MNASFFGAATAAPNFFPQAQAQQLKLIYEGFLSDLCPYNTIPTIFFKASNPSGIGKSGKVWNMPSYSK